eukprot:Sdes_comp9999_c0_seq1m1582
MSPAAHNEASLNSCAENEKKSGAEDAGKQTTIVGKLYSYEIVSNACLKATELYSAAKSYSPTVKEALDSVETVVSSLSEKAAPIVEPLMEKVQQKVDLGLVNEKGVEQMNHFENRIISGKNLVENAFASGKARMEETQIMARQKLFNAISTYEMIQTRGHENLENVKKSVYELGAAVQLNLEVQNKRLKQSLENIQELLKANIHSTQKMAKEGAFVLTENVHLKHVAESLKVLMNHLFESLSAASSLSISSELKAKSNSLLEDISKIYSQIQSEQNVNDQIYIKHVRTLVSIGKESVHLLEMAG